MIKKLSLIVFFVSFSLSGILAQQADYKNPKLSPDVQAQDLLKRMTTNKKIAQLQCI